jgi:hypothetical protein
MPPQLRAALVLVVTIVALEIGMPVSWATSDTFLFACVDSKWEGSFDAGDKFGHVVINVGLGNCSIGAANVSDKVAKGDCVETFGGVIKFCIIHINDGRPKLDACDCADYDVCVPRLALGKFGSRSGFTCRSSSGRIDGIVRRHCARNCV